MTHLTISQLKSRAIRKEVTGKDNGIRTISKGLKENLLAKILKKGGNLFKWILNLSGWIFGIITGGIGFTFSAVWGLLVSAVQFIWNFDWNQSDKSLDAIIENWKIQLAGQVGATLGNSVGYIICGGIPAYIAFTLNEPLGLYILKELGEEAFDEFIGNLSLLTNNLVQGALQAFLINEYKNTRKFIKTFFNDPNSIQSQLAARLFGANKLNNARKAWGSEGSKPWSFAIKFEEWKDSITNPLLQNFVEEFFDEFGDACIEAGYVVSSSLDSWFMEKKNEKSILLGDEAVVEIIPNRNNTEEKLILAGKEELLKPAIVQALGVTYPIMENRDVGMWVGEPVREMLKNDPISIQMKIILSSVKQPPLIDNGKLAKRVQITIPNVDKAKVDWENLKAALGGENGYLWGRFLGKMKLNNGTIMSLYADTADNATDRLNALLPFSKSEMLGLTITEEAKEGNRKKYENALYKQPTRIYPIGFTIINQTKVLNEENGTAQLSGVYKSKKAYIPLYTATKPDDFNEIINDLFHIPGAND